MEQVLYVENIIKKVFQKNEFLIKPDGAKLILLKKLRNNPAFTDASNPIMRDCEEKHDANFRNNIICISL